MACIQRQADLAQVLPLLGYMWKLEWYASVFPCLFKVTQSCPTLCDPVDCSPPGSSIHGILQASILEWVAISFSRGSSQLRDRTQVSHTAGRRFNLWATREAPFFSTSLLFQSPSETRTPCAPVSLSNNNVTSGQGSALTRHPLWWWPVTCPLHLPDQSLKDESHGQVCTDVLNHQFFFSQIEPWRCLSEFLV